MLKSLSKEELEDAILRATSRTAKPASRRSDKVPVGLDRILAALAHRRTRLIIELVRRHPQTAGEIAIALDLRPGVVSRYLTDLREAGITDETKSHRDGRERIISVKPDAFAILNAWIKQNSTRQRESDVP